MTKIESEEISLNLYWEKGGFWMSSVLWLSMGISEINLTSISGICICIEGIR